MSERREKAERRLAGRPGDVIRVPKLGPIEAKEGHDLVTLFLGACEKAVEPDVPAYLRQLGFQRIHAFEVTLDWDTEDRELHVFLAATPKEAVLAGVRFARWRERRIGNTLVGFQLALMRLGEINEDGSPHNGRGRTFAAWALDAEDAEGHLIPLESLCDSAQSPTAPSS